MKIRNPEKWYGKQAPNIEWEHLWRSIDQCNNCQCLEHPDNLHSLLYPASETDFALQEAVSVEEAQSFCPTCLEQIEIAADAFDPAWRKRHGL